MAFDTSIPFKIERFGVFQNVTVIAKAGASAVPAQASPFCSGGGGGASAWSGGAGTFYPPGGRMDWTLPTLPRRRVLRRKSTRPVCDAMTLSHGIEWSDHHRKPGEGSSISPSGIPPALGGRSCSQRSPQAPTNPASVSARAFLDASRPCATGSLACGSSHSAPCS